MLRPNLSQRLQLIINLRTLRKLTLQKMILNKRWFLSWVRKICLSRTLVVIEKNHPRPLWWNLLKNKRSKRLKNHFRCHHVQVDSKMSCKFTTGSTKKNSRIAVSATSQNWKNRLVVLEIFTSFRCCRGLGNPRILRLQIGINQKMLKRIIKLKNRRPNGGDRMLRLKSKNKRSRKNELRKRGIWRPSTSS